MATIPLRIIHPTDFSSGSQRAFAHALKLALATQGDLFLLHVEASKHANPHWSDFPHVRETLERWHILPKGASQDQVQTLAGIQVAKFDLIDKDIGHAASGFTAKYGGDLFVLDTEGRSGLAHWMSGSKAEAIFKSTNMATLFVPEQANGFVDPETGALGLRKIVAPVDHTPNPAHAIRGIAQLISPLGLPPHALHLVHAGDDAPVIHAGKNTETHATVECLPGPVVPAILEAAEDADLIAMATAGHHGLLDALRGSTTEQIIRNAPCPVLAIPAP